MKTGRKGEGYTVTEERERETVTVGGLDTAELASSVSLLI